MLGKDLLDDRFSVMADPSGVINWNALIFEMCTAIIDSIKPLIKYCADFCIIKAFV